MKYTLLIILCLSFIFKTNAQEDSLYLAESSENVISVFKTYENYRSFTPSGTIKGTIKYLRISKKDTTVIAAKPSFETKAGKIWGFSDGRYVFVRYFGAALGPRFWRLQCTGPNPYLFYKEKMLLATGPGLAPLITLAATTAIPANIAVRVITKSGSVKETNKKNLKRVFSDSPALLDSLKKVSVFDKKKIIELLKIHNGVD